MNNLPSPPILAVFLFKLMFPDDGDFTTLGDLEEVYQVLCEEKGVFRAKLWYWQQLLKSIPHFVDDFFYWRLVMFRNYFTVALRNFNKQKTYHFINIFGLSVGIAFSILTFLFIQNEWTYDAFHSQKGNIFRVVNRLKQPQGAFIENAITSIPLGPTLEQEYPEIEQSTRFFDRQFLLQIPEKSFNEIVLFADVSLFTMFDFPILLGDPSKPLPYLNSMVISQQVAKKYFGARNPIGEHISIRYNNTDQDFTITAMAKQIPANSTIHFDFLIPFNNMAQLSGIDMDNWYPSAEVTTYIQVNPEVSPTELEAKFADFFVKSPHHPFMQRYDLKLQPLTAIHLEPMMRSPDREPVGNPTYSFILAGISLLVLLMACINFINLSIGQSFRRVGEVGIRKVIGATRIQLMKQFWVETLFLGFFSLLLGILLAELFLPVFNDFTQSRLALEYLHNPSILLFFMGLVAFVGIVAGIYPAFLISGFHPLDVLKARLKIRNTGPVSRTLVIFQFTISIVLIICATVMVRQVSYLSEKELGFNPDLVLLISTKHLPHGSQDFLGRYKNELAHDARISNISAFDNFINSTMAGGRIKNSLGDEVTFTGYYVDYNLIETLQMKLIDGRNFSPGFPSDVRNACIINENFAKSMGWTSPCGQILPFRLSTAKWNPETGEMFIIENPEVVGVIQDYHFRSLHYKLEPIALFLNPLYEYEIVVRISSQDITSTIEMLAEKWQALAPLAPFEYRFLDEAIQQQYQREQRWTRIITYASLFAIFIACLGLVGLSMFAAVRRTREISIRKVLGASVSSIVKLVSQEFVQLVLIANLIAWPVAWYIMQKWLDNFAYRVPQQWWIFSLAGVIVISAAFISVSVQALKVARGKSLYKLRSE